MSANITHYSFFIGSIRAMVISDGQALFPAYPLYAPNAKPEAVAQSLRRHFLPEDSYQLQCNILYLETGVEKVLIDSGAGSILGSSLGKLLLHLRNAGLAPADITTVLLTHAHLDHVSGLVSPTDGSPVFPKARIRLSEPEWHFWRQADPDLSTMPISGEFRKNFKQAAHRNLLTLQARIEPFQFGEEVVPGVNAINAPGHSPGHTIFQVNSGHDSLLHAGDIFHHDAFDLEHPRWATAFDQDAKRAYQTRRRVLDQAVSDRSWLMSYHIPFPSLGHLSQRGHGYRWDPDQWQLN